MAETERVNVGIIGYTGRTGMELQELLENHPRINMVYYEKSDGWKGRIDDADFLFLAVDAETSLKKVPQLFEQKKKIIDMSGAYRLPQEKFEKWYKIKHTSPELTAKAVYGLPEINREEIKNASFVANPGCYATVILLALYPVRNYTRNIHIDATSGISGAGKYPIPDGSIKPYAPFREHKHVPEIEFLLEKEIAFYPQVNEAQDRGITAIIHYDTKIPCDNKIPDVEKKSKIFYENEKFVKFGVEHNIAKKNSCYLSVEQKGKTVRIISEIDNLRKGAASQAIQNFNLMYGFEESAGLKIT